MGSLLRIAPTSSGVGSIIARLWRSGLA